MLTGCSDFGERRCTSIEGDATLTENLVGLQETPPDRVVVKLRLDQNYDAFIRENKIASTLSTLATALHVTPSTISLLAIRSGCVVVVVELEKEPGQKLVKHAKLFRKYGMDPAEVEGLSSEIVDMLNALHVQTVVEGDPVEAPYFIRRIDLNPELSWLHLSDLHMTADYTDSKSNTNADLTRFLDDLPQCLQEAKITPDAIFFTGDVAQSGYQEEYDAAVHFFNEVKNRVSKGLPTAPFIAIPGNHDVSWSNIDSKEEKKMRARLAKHGVDANEVVKEFAAHILKRHENFVAFSKKFNDPACKPFDGYAFAQFFEPSTAQINVGVAGLNSAWLSTKKDLYKQPGLPDFDLQNLLLGRAQLSLIPPIDPAVGG